MLGPYALPYANAVGCAYTAWATAARQAAGPSLDAYDHVVYVLPPSPGCAWGGQAYIAGREAWLNGEITLGSTAAHEIGHNLGSDHARAARCYRLGDDRPDQPAAPNGNCRLLEYGDAFDVMGGGAVRSYATFSAWRRDSLGWLPPEAVATDTAGGRYVLAPTDRPLDGTTRLLRVPLPDGRVVTLDHRGTGGRFGDELVAGSPVTVGATLRLEVPSPAPTVGGRTTALLDTTPETTGQGFYGLNLDDAPLLPYTTFADPLGAFAVTVAGPAADGLPITVVRAPGDVVPPGAPGVPTITRSGVAATITVPPATDDRGVSGYRILRDGVAIGTTTTTTFTDTAAGSGRRVYAVRAFDAAGNHGAESRRVPSTPDRQAPETPFVTIIQPWEGDAAPPLTLQWPAVRDDVGVVQYVVRRGGAVLGRTSVTTWVDPFAWSGADPGWTVEAVDAAGNVSPPGRAVDPVPLADAAAPAAPADLRAAGATGAVQLGWSAVPDAAGYKVFGDGRLLGETRTPSFAVASVAPGPHRFSVRSYDAARNTSAAPAAVDVLTAGPPAARTDPAADVTADAATLVGHVDPNFGAVRWWFEWGATPAYGSRTAAVDLAAGAPARAVGVRLTGLTPGTTYHARLVVHGLAAAGGESRSFATLVPPPIVTPGTGAPDGPATVPPPVGPTVPTPVLPPAPVGDPPPPTPPVVRAGTGARAVATLTVVSGRRVRGAVVLRLRASAAGTLRVRAGSRLLVAVRVRRPGVVTVRLRPARTVRRVTAELTPTGSARPVRRTVRLPA